MSERQEQGRVWLRIKGRVQGVGFRFSTVGQARRLGLSGWVRNTHDGHVELVAEGEKDPLQRLVAWCHIGPRGALVSDVEQRWAAYQGEFDTFRIRHGDS